MSYLYIKIKNSVIVYVYMLWAKWQNKVFFNSIILWFFHSRQGMACKDEIVPSKTRAPRRLTLCEVRLPAVLSLLEFRKIFEIFQNIIIWILNSLKKIFKNLKNLFN